MYHVSKTYLGKIIVLLPSIPNSRNQDECSQTKRICVSPTVRQCLLGIDGIEELKYSKINHNGWFIYKTKDVGAPATDVFDFAITEEHWIDKESKFDFIGKVNLLDKDELIIDDTLIMPDYSEKLAKYIEMAYKGEITENHLVHIKINMYIKYGSDIII